MLMNRSRNVFWLSATTLLLVVACSGVATGPPTTFEQAKAQAASRGVPVLLDFYTDW